MDGRAAAHAPGENIAAPFVRENTLAGYRVAVNVHLVPGLGRHRLDRLEPEHLEKLYVRMMKNGSAPATAYQAHRTIRTALNEAVRRGHLARNPATLAKAPRLPEAEVEPYSVDEIRLLLKSGMEVRNAGHGGRSRLRSACDKAKRSGSNGTTWTSTPERCTSDVVDYDRTGTHGCDGTYGRRFGGHCPMRVALRDEMAETKSRAGRHRIGLPDQLVELLRAHREEQDREREAAQLWTDGGWVFATPTGSPLNPRTDWTDWKRLITRAGVRDGQLHDARHTAATVLLLLGVPERAVMGVMGWSNTAMAARYQHVTATIQRDIAGRVGGRIWEVDEGPAETE